MAISSDEALTVRLGSDLKFPIKGSFEPTSGLNLLLQDIQRLLLTVPGERPFRPNFGCKLMNQIWENEDNAARNGESAIKTALDLFEPRITVTSIKSQVNRNTGLITFSIRFVVKATNTPVNLIFPFRTSTQLSFA